VTSSLDWGSDNVKIGLVPCAGLQLRSADDSRSDAESEVAEPVSIWINCALWEGVSVRLLLKILPIVGAKPYKSRDL
jgi:hypothetical protein